MNSELFTEYVTKLSRKLLNKPFALFMDRAGFHRAKIVCDELERLSIRRILNVPYGPDYNPIEGCFSIVKNFFKRKRLNAIRNNRTFNYQQQIILAFK